MAVGSLPRRRNALEAGHFRHFLNWEEGSDTILLESTLSEGTNMDKPARLVKLSIVLTILLCIAALDDFLSLHDIFKDYVSQPALSSLGIQTSKSLPDWTGTPLEWTSVTVSYLFRVVILVFNLILLTRLAFCLRAHHQA